jgi:hypothetical protein
VSARPGDDGVDPSRLPTTPLPPRTAGSLALGRAMLALDEIIEGKPPREAYEHVVESDDSGEPEDPEDLVVEI